LELKNLDINFAILRLYCKYFQIVASCRKSENGVLVYFGPQTEKPKTVELTHLRSIVYCCELGRWNLLKFHTG